MAKPEGVSIHHHMQERFDLAQTYALDGAFHTAAKLLGELAADVKKHAVDCDVYAKEVNGLGESKGVQCESCMDDPNVCASLGKCSEDDDTRA